MNIADIRNCVLFSALSDKEIGKVLEFATEREFEAGAVIFRDGDRAQELFVVIEGKIALQMTSPGESNRSVSVDLVTKNDELGWPAIVEPYVYSLTAVCLQKSKVIAINGSKLKWWIEENPAVEHAILKGLVKVLISRLEETRHVLITERLISHS